MCFVLSEDSRGPKFYVELFPKLFRNIGVRCTQSHEKQIKYLFGQQTPFKNVLVLLSMLNLVSEWEQLLFKIIIMVYLMFSKNVNNNLQCSHFFYFKKTHFLQTNCPLLRVTISNLNDLSSTTLSTSVAKPEQ